MKSHKHFVENQSAIELSDIAFMNASSMFDYPLTTFDILCLLDYIPGALELALKTSLVKVFFDRHPSSLVSSKSIHPVAWSRERCCSYWFVNLFLCQDTCFAFRDGVASSSVQEVAIFGKVDFGHFFNLQACRIFHRFLVLDAY